MGIYDREYYRRESPGLFGGFAGRGQVWKQIILINVIVFVLQLALRGRFTEWFVLDTDDVLNGQVWRLLTYAFLHDPTTPWHILFNMLFLWWFGSDVEDLYGSKEFLAFYLISALLGGVFFTAVAASRGVDQVCLGASGAITAVLVLCALHYPTRVIYIWMILPVPIWIFVIFNVGQDLFFFLNPDLPTRTAVTVHLTGAAFAFVYYKRQWRLLGLLSGLKSWQKQRSRPSLRVYREETPEPVPVAAPPASDIDEHLEAKLDAVLEKVARHGQGSLTDKERQILVRASEVYKKRRT